MASLPGPTPTPDPADLRRIAQALLQAVVEALPIGLSVEDPDGRKVFANATAAGHGSGAPDDRPAGTGLALATETANVSVEGRAYTVRLSRDVTAQRELEDKLFGEAYFDETTGLPNRVFVKHSVGELIARGADERFALVLLDIDHFKLVNDHYGYAAGDDLLMKIGRRLSAAVRETDLVARVGCDAFALLLTPVGDRESVLADVDRLLQRIGDPFFIAGHEVFVTASVGIGLHPDHGGDEATLRANADLAMSRMKGRGKGGVALYDPGLARAASERLMLEQRLRAAIRERRLCCVFQPKVDLRTAAVVGLEVLMRWRDEQGAIQPPGAVLALAADLGLMDEITHILLDQTIASIGLIDMAFGPEATISVNIAARQAGQYGFMLSVAEAIEATGCAGRFMLELTEEAFLHKGDFQARVMPMLKAHGIKVSIDDFGTGYSSLSALADITADEVKVDRSFITDIHRRPRNQMILRAVESLGHALGMSVIVEGVETAEELAWLQAATGIRYAQGFYFARPMFLDDLVKTTTLKDRQAAPARAATANRQAARRSR